MADDFSTLGFQPESSAPQPTGDFSGLGFTPDEAQPNPDVEKHDTIAGQVATAALGAANSMTAGLGSKALDASGILSAEEQRNMREANPISYGVGNVGGLFSGPMGEGIAAAGAGAKALLGGGVAGSTAALAAESALVQTTDEVAKAMMKDPNQTLQTAAVDVGLAGILGGAFGAAGGLTGKGLQKVADSKFGEFLGDFRNRLAQHVEPASYTSRINPDYIKPFSPAFKDAEMFIKGEEVPKPPMSTENLSLGEKAADAFMKSKLTGEGVGAALGHSTGIPLGGWLGARTLGPTLDAVIKPIIRGMVNPESFLVANKLTDSYLTGVASMVKAAKAVFNPAMEVLPGALATTKENRDSIRDALKTFQDDPHSILKAGGTLESSMPDHNVAVGQLMGQAVQHLTSIQPKPSGGKSPLDSEIAPTKGQQSMFDRSLNIANQPLTVLQHIKDGTLMSNDLKTFMAVSPALHQPLSSALVKQMIEHKAKGEPIPYRTRAGLSLFMGQPMDSTMSPMALQSVQNGFHPPQPVNQAQKGSKKPPQSGLNKLSQISSQTQTAEQSREARRNK